MQKHLSIDWHNPALESWTTMMSTTRLYSYIRQLERHTKGKFYYELTCGLPTHIKPHMLSNFQWVSAGRLGGGVGAWYQWLVHMPQNRLGSHQEKGNNYWCLTSLKKKSITYWQSHYRDIQHFAKLSPDAASIATTW